MNKEDQILISLCYYPLTNNVEATWERDGIHVEITFSVAPEQGEALAKIVSPCVYHRVICKEQTKSKELSIEYKNGYDSIMNGVTTENCHFSNFLSKEQTLDWQQGVDDAKKQKGINNE